jgi:DnaJ-domain-containing protein 1
MTAESMQDTLLLDNEELDMDLAMAVLDEFMQAIITSRSSHANEACLESEAMASVGIGEFHFSVLKNEERGHQHLLQAILLADSLTHSGGGTFFNKPWFKRAKEIIEEFRRKRLAFDQAEVAANRDPTMKKLKPQLDAIEASMNAFQGKCYKLFSLLCHLYKDHPPKNGNPLDQSINRDDKDALKKACLKAVVDYHPDKPFNKREGLEWYILCEEIVKHLNAFYDFLKS